MIGSRFLDFVLSVFGRGRAKLGEWPHGEIVVSALATFRSLGGEFLGESGTPADELRTLRFRVRGHRVRLCIEDYGAVTLWGPRRLVAELAAQIAQDIARRMPKEAPGRGSGKPGTGSMA